MKNSQLITVDNPKSPNAEAYKTLRTNIQFSSFDKKIKTIMITSSGPGEGKTTTASNLAVVLAQGGHKTILVDCDTRKANLHRIFNISNSKGLTNLLIGESTFEDVLNYTEQENLLVITAGVIPPNPSELLDSKKMRGFVASLKEKFDYIILDTPPVTMVTDAQILSQYSDGCILVVASGETYHQAATRAKNLLTKVNTNILGIVLNKLDTSRIGYYGHYYGRYYEEEHDSNFMEKKRNICINLFNKVFRKKDMKIAASNE